MCQAVLTNHEIFHSVSLWTLLITTLASQTATTVINTQKHVSAAKILMNSLLAQQPIGIVKYVKAVEM